MVNKANKIGSNYRLAQLLKPVTTKTIYFCKTKSIRFGTDILCKPIYCLEPVLKQFFFYFLFFIFYIFFKTGFFIQTSFSHCFSKLFFSELFLKNILNLTFSMSEKLYIC